ncbi:MAG: TonB-dependent receptor, partial [Porticoccus sp.]|nr:TonB-dependent receptor [Porticoccus sp.]
LGSVSLNWQATNQLSVNLNAQYNGSQDDNFFPPPSFQASPVKLDDYTLLNLSANYQVNKQLAFYTRLDNILDEDYEDVFGFQPLGFGAVMGVRYNFSQ